MRPDPARTCFRFTALGKKRAAAGAVLGGRRQGGEERAEAQERPYGRPGPGRCGEGPAPARPRRSRPAGPAGDRGPRPRGRRRSRAALPGSAGRGLGRGQRGRGGGTLYRPVTRRVPDKGGARPGAPSPAGRLARTRSGPEDLAFLLDGLHSRRLVLLKSLLTRLERRPSAVPGHARERFAEHWRLLERAEEHAPLPVRDTLDHPSVGNWLAAALTAADGEPLTRSLDHFGAVAATAALRAGTDFALDLAAPGGILALPGAGLARTGAETVRLTAHGRTARLTADGRRAGPVLLRAAGRLSGAGAGWQGLRRLPGSGACLDDLDPYRAPSGGVGRAALPAAPREAGGHEPWLRRWRAALALLRATDPQRAAETVALLRCLVPLARHGAGGRVLEAGAKASATFRAAPGAVFTTPPESAAELAEVLVHETQHSKLSVLHDLVPLHQAAPGAVHRVAWRADPRPLAGVLQGTYAHLALADFWDRAARRRPLPPAAAADARARRDSYGGQVAQALPILLESGELTPEGREFVEGMERHLAVLLGTAGHCAPFGGTSPAGDVR
ncbi:hypothetical protein CYQ11_21430 [Streptomyces cinnamoneus]|nr:hypothetical protein CYQ11_21430 [Streptomyces cinnamoneus]